MKKILYAFCCLLLTQELYAQNYLATHNLIRTQVASSIFKQRPGTTIPADNKCITADEARSWLYLDESTLPTNGRMPWYQELKPCNNVYVLNTIESLNVYTACGSYIYNVGYNVDLRDNCARSKIKNNSFWAGDTTVCGVNICTSASPSSIQLNAKSARLLSTTANTGDTTPMVTSRIATNGLMAAAAWVAPAGPMNRCGIKSLTPDEQWTTMTIKRTLTHAGTYYIGVGADNYFRVSVDNQLVAKYEGLDQAAFELWHIVPVTLTAGDHYFTIGYSNHSSASGLGVEMYDNTAAQLRAATSYSTLNLIFSTADFRGSNVSLCY